MGVINVFNMNTDIEKKRQFLLEYIEKIIEKIKMWENLRGPGIKRKILRVVCLPDIYITYIFCLLLKPKKISFKLFNQRTIMLDIIDRASASLYAFKCLDSIIEYKLTKFLIKYFKSNDVFYDIGGSFGFYTYLALEFCKEVHYFEPVPFVFEIVKYNLKNESRVTLNNVAIGKSNKIAWLYILNSNTSRSTIVKNSEKLHSYKKIEIKVISLEEYIHQTSSKPTIIKLDVEGAELEVIEGAINFFKNESPLIIMEVHNKNYAGESSINAVEKLISLNYKPYCIDLEGRLNEIKGDLMDVLVKENLEVDNFVFMKQ
uniref:FkbM family methyltransferase n=1 Tax=Thermodesulfobacterium geofontis TaxID=1295609 RepID=A0A7V6CEM5_9BACT